MSPKFSAKRLTLCPIRFRSRSRRTPKQAHEASTWYLLMIDYKADPTFWQRFLKCAGFYGDEIDGAFGPNSMQAAHDFEQASIALANQLGSFDGRREATIQTLLPAAQRKARETSHPVLSPDHNSLGPSGSDEN